MFRAARPLFQQSSRAAFRSQFTRSSGRRFQSTAAGGEGSSQKQQQQSWFKRMWDSPIGLKTVHFW
jgi:mitochondrial pyruvate carrier 2